MNKPFRFRYVNEIAAAFVGCLVIVVVLGIVLAARAQKWFEQTYPIQIELPEQGSYGLKDGGEIQMLGTVVGAIDRIRPPDAETGRMMAIAHVDPEFAHFIRTGTGGSTATIRVPIALKDPFIEISFRRQGDELPRRGTLIAQAETDASDALNKTLADVQTKILPAAQHMIDEYAGVATDWRNPKGSVQAAFDNIAMAAGNLSRTDGVVGRITTDKKLADQLVETLAKLSSTADDIRAGLSNLRETTAELPKLARNVSAGTEQLPAILERTQGVMLEAQKSLADLQKSTAQLPATVTSLRQAVDQLPDVMAHTQQTLVEVQKLVRGMQGLPFVRDNIEQTAPAGAALRPGDVGGPQ